MAKNIKLTENNAKKSPQGGVLVGKKDGQTIIYDDGKVGGWFVGKTHKEGGIQGIDKTTGQPIEVQTGEVIITAPALADQTPREFQGKMLTNRQILSKINSDAGGVAFAEDGMEIPSKILFKGGSYKYGGKMMSDKEIADEINKCGCEHDVHKFEGGGNLKKVPLKTINKIKKLSDRIVEIEKMNLGNDVYSYNGDLSFKERNKLISEQEKLQNELTEVTNELSKEQCYSINSDSFRDLNTAGDYGYEENEYINGGHLSEGMSLEDIAKKHGVTLEELDKQVEIGMEDESIHAGDYKDHFNIVKDHLVESPTFYTDEQKAQGENEEYEIGGIFHGSPYSFDKFTTEKMSSGSGKQIDGWGVYLTDYKDSSKIYGRNVYETILFKGKDLNEYTLIDLSEPIKKEIVSKIVKAVYKNKNKDFDINKFNLYYDYSKDKSLPKVDFNDYELVEFDYSGFLFYKTLSRILGGDKNASLFLLDNGIDGLKRNISKKRIDYIIFDADNITIENKESFAGGGLIAPNGNPSNLTPEQYHLVRTPEFKAWFGDWENEPANSSEILDENGEPKIMYHGSRGDFNVFSNENENKLSWTEGGFGFYFTSNYNSALGYGRKVISAFINSRAIKKSNETEHAFVNQTDLYKLRKSGFDSIYFNGKFTNTSGKRTSKDDELVVFEPNQIKLADGTNTTFDKYNDDIRFVNGGQLEIGGNYRIKNNFGSFSTIKIMPIDENLRTSKDFFSVEVTVRAKDGDNIKIRKNPLTTYPISKYNSFMEDLEKRNPIKFNKGGEMKKENLVKDAKDGNTPARDLNNYNDMLDVQADGQVGGDSGIYKDGGKIGDWDTNFTSGFNKGQKLSEQEIETIDVYNDFIYGLLFKSGGSFDAKTEETIGLLSITNNPINLAVILEKDPSGFNAEAIKYNQKIKRRLHNLAEKSNRKIVLNNNASSRVNRQFPYLLVSENDAKNYDLANEFYEKLETPRKESRKKLIEELEKEKQGKKEYEYVLTQRPFGIGTYPTENFIRFEDKDYQYGVLIYSQKVPLKDVEHYSLSPITELKEYDDKTLTYLLGKLKIKAKVKLVEDKRKGYFVNVFFYDSEGIQKTQMMSGVNFLKQVQEGKFLNELEKENNYENKNLDELREIHKNKYSNMPIESSKSDDEKLLDKLIAEKFSLMNQEVREKREEKKSFESEGSTEGKGKLYEFFTPQIVADKMLALAQHYGFKGGNVLEPATGSGRLIKNLKNTNITAFEISKNNFEILKREFPNAELYNFNFEKAFLKEPRFNTLLNRKGTETWLKNAPFDLVLANPPYGKFSGLYSSYFKFKGQVEHFFILQTLHLLKKGGLGVYLIPSSFMRNGIAYNDIKKEIFEIAELVDAYRLPSNIFEKTQIGTDILILRKK